MRQASFFVLQTILLLCVTASQAGLLTGLAITLSSNAKAIVTTASFTFIPTTAVISGPNAGIRITLSGAGIALDTSPSPAGSVCTVTSPNGATCNSILVNSVLEVRLTSGQYVAGSVIYFAITKFTTPTNGQAALSNIPAATSNDLSVSAPTLLDTTNSGTFPVIVDSTEGKEKHRISTCNG
jgi:hypothetical protein